MIKNLLFDFDGTIADTRRGIVNCMHYSFDRLGVERVADERVYELIGQPLEDMFCKLLGRSDMEYIMQGVGYFRERYGKKGVYEYELFPDVVKTLALLSEEYNLFVVTLKPEIYAKQICEENDMLRYFTDVAGSSLTGICITKSKLMGQIIERYNINPEEAIMYGDRSEDVIAANDNKVRSVGMLYGFGTKEELESAGCHNLCGSFAEVRKTIHFFPNML